MNTHMLNPSGACVIPLGWWIWGATIKGVLGSSYHKGQHKNAS